MSQYRSPDWVRCARCGLTEPARKHTLDRCNKMLKGEPLGGHPRPMPALFSVDAMPEPPPPNFYMGIKPPPRELEPSEDLVEVPAKVEANGFSMGTEHVIHDNGWIPP